MNKRALILVPALALTIGGVVAHARSIGGGAGNTSWVDRPCFDINWSGIQQNCNGTKGWNVYLTGDTTNIYMAPTYSVTVPTGSHVACQSVSMSQDHNTVWKTQLVNNPTDGRSIISPGNVWFPAGGDLTGTCSMDQGTILNNVVY
jgi:hypothetical protein